MSQQINNVHIKNFKSIKDLEFNSNRINIFIGEPNVGKSNVLEALSLFSPYFYKESSRFQDDVIRYNELSNFIYDDDLNNMAVVSLNNKEFNNVFFSIDVDGSYFVNFKTDKSTFTQFTRLGSLAYRSRIYSERLTAMLHLGIFNEKGELQQELLKERTEAYSESLRDKSSDFEDKLPTILRYIYSEKHETSNKKTRGRILKVPFGGNLFSVIDSHESLRTELSNYFSQYGLNFVLSKKDKIIEIQKHINGYVYKYPYESIADTFKRLIFYLSAIKSNSNTVILLEEPEVHSFPPYIKDVANSIINNTSNQYFISTHSPYLLYTLLENKEIGRDLSVFVTYYEDYQTKIKELTKKDLTLLIEFGYDIFSNLKDFYAK